MKTKNNKNFGYKKLFITVAVLIVVLILFDFTPLGGNIRFYSTWVKCGTIPLRTNAYPGGGVRWYEKAPAFQPIFRGGNYETYFCSPLQAERAGYSANPDTYEFPHLAKD